MKSEKKRGGSAHFSYKFSIFIRPYMTLFLTSFPYILCLDTNINFFLGKMVQQPLKYMTSLPPPATPLLRYLIICLYLSACMHQPQLLIQPCLQDVTFEDFCNLLLKDHSPMIRLLKSETYYLQKSGSVILYPVSKSVILPYIG